MAEAWLFCVRAAGGRYAFEAALVSEVIRLGPLTRLPGSPPALPGVFPYRGEVLAVLDLGRALAGPGVAIGAATRVAVLRVGDYRLALLPDGIEGLVASPSRGLQPSPAQGGPAAPFVRAVGSDSRGPLAILDLAGLVESARVRSPSA